MNEFLVRNALEQVKNSEAFQFIFEKLRGEYKEKIMLTLPNEKLKREEMYLKYQMLDDVEITILDIMNSYINLEVGDLNE